MGDVPVEILAAMEQLPTGVSYVFASSDEQRTVRLSMGSVAVTFHRYERWELFITTLLDVVTSFAEAYSPSFFSRIGLRYQNAIQRSELRLEDVPWSQLLRPEVAGELSLEAWCGAEEAHSNIRTALDDHGSFVRFQHGLGNLQGTEELVYVLDFDFYTDRDTEVKYVADVAERLHGYSGNAFRWAISSKLDQAMGPKSV